MINAKGGLGKSFYFTRKINTIAKGFHAEF